MRSTTARSRTALAAGLAALLGVLCTGVALVVTAARPTEDPTHLATVAQSREALASAAGARAFFGHQSVGSNVLSGVDEVYSRAGLAPPPVVESSTTPDVAGGFLAHAVVGQDADPESKIRDFGSILTGSMGDTVGVALMKFSYVDVTADTDIEALFTRYRRSMARVAAQRPDVTLLHATVPLTTDRGLKGRIKALIGRGDTVPADNAARERFNALIRAEYGDTGRLWDIAAIESTAPDGTRVSGTFEVGTYYSMYSGYAADPGHLNGTGSAEAAAALLPLIAQNARA